MASSYPHVGRQYGRGALLPAAGGRTAAIGGTFHANRRRDRECRLRRPGRGQRTRQHNHRDVIRCERQDNRDNQARYRFRRRRRVHLPIRVPETKANLPSCSITVSIPAKTMTKAQLKSGGWRVDLRYGPPTTTATSNASGMVSASPAPMRVGAAQRDRGGDARCGDHPPQSPSSGRERHDDADGGDRRRDRMARGVGRAGCGDKRRGRLEASANQRSGPCT